jgi:hypothetical protein
MVRIIVPVQQSHCMKAQLSLTTFFGFLDSHGANAYDNVESAGRKLRTSGCYRRMYLARCTERRPTCKPRIL